MSAFDVWVIRFEQGERSPAERLERAFGIDAARAKALERSLPKVVKHGVPAKAAGEMRQALEAIGAVVQCRPTRETARADAPDAPAVFRPPGVDIPVGGRVSAIDPFAPTNDPSVPRISVEDVLPPLPAAAPTKASPPSAPVEEPKRIAASLLATSRAQQRRTYIRQAAGTILAGVAILVIGWFFGSSVFRGEADWVGIGFDGLGIYFLGTGLFELVTSMRS